MKKMKFFWIISTFLKKSTFSYKKNKYRHIILDDIYFSIFNFNDYCDIFLHCFYY